MQFVKTFKGGGVGEEEKKLFLKTKAPLGFPQTFLTSGLPVAVAIFEASECLSSGRKRAEGLPHAGETERSLAHAGHVLRGSPPHTLCFSLSSLTCLPLCPGHPSPSPIAFSLFMCQQHYHGEPPYLFPPPATSTVSDGCFVLPLPFVLLSCLKAICETGPIAG